MATIKTAIQLYDSASPALRSMTNALNVVINTFESMQGACNRGVDVSSLQVAREELARVNTTIDSVEKNIQQAKEKQDSFNGSMKEGAGFAKMLKSAFIAIGGAMAIGEMFKMSDELTQTKARLDMMNDGLQTTEQLQNMIFQSAQRARGAYQSSADAVSKMGIMAGDAFKSNAELVAFVEQLNKQFAIAGTSQEGISSAMLQLTQAMGSGVLRGEELNSVFEQAPTIIQAIAGYLNVPIGKIREMAGEGQLTAEVVKNALLATAEETNARFESMPMTMGQSMQAMKNQALMQFQPVLQKINELINNEKFNVFTNNALSAIANIANLSIIVFEKLIAIADFVAENWSYIEPIIWGVVSAMLIYNAVSLLTNGILATQTIIEGVRRASLALSTGATFTATVAQEGLNSALLACPITWIVLGIIAIITVIILLCNWIAKSTGVAESWFGVLMGGMATAGAFIVNVIVGLINAMMELLMYMLTPWLDTIEFIVNAFSGGFDGIGGMFKSLLGNMINGLLQFAKIATPIIDAIFGTSLTDKISGLQTEIRGWGKTENAFSINRNITGLERIEYSTAFEKGAEWGDSVSKKISGIFSKEDIGFDQYDTSNLLEGIYTTTGSTATDTAKIADSMGELEDSLEYMRDIAEREVINRFTTAEIKVEQTNNNNINSMLDLDEIMEKWNNDFMEVLETSSEGVH